MKSKANHRTFEATFIHAFRNAYLRIYEKHDFRTKRNFSKKTLTSVVSSFEDNSFISRAQISIDEFCINAELDFREERFAKRECNAVIQKATRQNCFFQQAKAWQSYSISLLHNPIQHAFRQRRLRRLFSNGPMAISPR